MPSVGVRGRFAKTVAQLKDLPSLFELDIQCGHVLGPKQKAETFGYWIVNGAAELYPGYASRKWEMFSVQSSRCSQNHPDATTIVLNAAYTAIAAAGEAAQAKVRDILRAEEQSIWVKWAPSSAGVCRRFLLPVTPSLEQDLMKGISQY